MLPPLRYRERSHLTRNRPQKLPPRIWLAFQDGQFNILGLGAWYSYWRDPYYLLLTIPWPGFLALMACCYLALNVLFACAYLVGGDCIANATPGSFTDAFFFSVQTLATIGYGAMYPTTTYAHVLVTLEVLTSIIGIALMTGLAFARFAQPTARIIFSQVTVVTPRNGVPTLMFRVANQRRNQILEAETRLYFMRDEISAEGEFTRRFYELKLVRNRTPAFTLPWTVMHAIDEDSPLYAMTPESLAKTKAMLVVSLSGIDETVAQAIHARYTYGAKEILWSRRFVDIVHNTPEGHRYVDYTHFHEVAP